MDIEGATAVKAVILYLSRSRKNGDFLPALLFQGQESLRLSFDDGCKIYVGLLRGEV